MLIVTVGQIAQYVVVKIILALQLFGDVAGAFEFDGSIKSVLFFLDFISKAFFTPFVHLAYAATVFLDYPAKAFDRRVDFLWRKKAVQDKDGFVNSHFTSSGLYDLFRKGRDRM